MGSFGSPENVPLRPYLRLLYVPTLPSLVTP